MQGGVGASGATDPGDNEVNPSPEQVHLRAGEMEHSICLGPGNGANLQDGVIEPGPGELCTMQEAHIGKGEGSSEGDVVGWGQVQSSLEGVQKTMEDGEGDGELLAPLGDAVEPLETLESPLHARVREGRGVKAQVDMPGGQGSEMVADHMVAPSHPAKHSDPLNEVQVRGGEGHPVGAKTLEAEGLVLTINRVILVVGALAKTVQEEGSCMCRVAKESGEGWGGEGGGRGLGEGSRENSCWWAQGNQAWI
ncbi:hypothetical protein NDA14_004016 [Ustilago hordei]|nr:hypothetical protein NDA10_002456 [Ustilago hordei]KAJ1583434.1 hypothetical protein NDA15_003550 [Ustilago hordei]KAJ1592095.1 hypothetical protein NDA12_005564 [Ustilago hordei]KAJ1603149.1 hypothetical protein NDA14_004016 [Ustilago hordei]